MADSPPVEGQPPDATNDDDDDGFDEVGVAVREVPDLPREDGPRASSDSAAPGDSARESSSTPESPRSRSSAVRQSASLKGASSHDSLFKAALRRVAESTDSLARMSPKQRRSRESPTGSAPDLSRSETRDVLGRPADPMASSHGGASVASRESTVPLSEYSEGSHAEQAMGSQARRRRTDFLARILSPVFRDSSVAPVAPLTPSSLMVTPVDGNSNAPSPTAGRRRRDRGPASWNMFSKNTYQPRLSLAEKERPKGRLDEDMIWDKLREPTAREKVDAFMRSAPVVVLMIACTLWVLFIDDVQALALPKSSDRAVGGVSFAVFLVFLLEFVVLCVVQRGQFVGQLFFFLDLLAIVSLVPSVLDYFHIAGVSSQVRSLALARAGRAARAGARAGRIIRVARISRLFGKRETTNEKRSSKVQDAQTATRVGARLETSTSNKYTVALLVLLLILNLTSDNTDNSPGALQRGLDNLCMQPGATSQAMADLQLYVVMFPDVLCVTLSYAVTCLWGSPQAIEHELRSFEYVTYDSWCGTAYFDVRSTVMFQARLSIVLTCCLIVFLYVGNYLFQRDLRILVLDPISKMAQIITGIAENPLLNVGTYTPVTTQDETGLLMTMITKLGYLLQVAFGHAGSHIISENMGTDGDLQPMVPGHKISAVFGFCDIRNFTDVTEGLKEKVMVFVNTVAEIVHEGVHRNNGAPNKNIGDAFLLVWRAADDDGPNAGAEGGAAGGGANGASADQGESSGLASSSNGGMGPSSNTQRRVVPQTTSNNNARQPSTMSRAHDLRISALTNTPAGRSPTPKSLMNTPDPSNWSGRRRPGEGTRASHMADVGTLRRSVAASVASDISGGRQAKGARGFEREQWVVSGLEEGVVGALHSYLDIQEELHFSPKIKDLERDVGKFLSGYSVRMGFGYHVGWAIEGPIGSQYKVDASYLSPHVNIAARLESATKMYGVGILVSGQFHALLPEPEQRMLVKLDLVMLKGSATPVYLYTLNPWLLDATDKAYFSHEIYSLTREEFEPATLAATRYERALSAYIDGSWRLAKELFQTFTEEPGHLSTTAQLILDFMKATDFAPPADWTGVRALTEK